MAEQIESSLKTPRTTLLRRAVRGTHEFAEIAAILDSTFVCHIGFVVDGQPYVIPTGFGRKDDMLYFHGSVASRTLRNMSDGLPVCITVTLVDGVILARCAFRHSMNYRSVVVLGKAEAVDRSEIPDALKIMSDHIVPGRWEDVRGPNASELAQTTVMRMPISEASAKIRVGPPLDLDEDMGLRVWAGIMPFSHEPMPLIPDPRGDPTVPVPDYLANYRRPGSK